MMTKLGIAVAVGTALSVFFPKQCTGDPGTAEFFLEVIQLALEMPVSVVLVERVACVEEMVNLRFSSLNR
jgi:hypothetical protein